VTLFDATSEQPHSRARVYAVSGVALVILLSFGAWYFFLRFLSERRTIERFLDAVIAENFQAAYQIWQPKPTYTFEDFMADWGLTGYYGPIKSYRVYSLRSPGDANGTVVVVEVSPESTFPSDQDPKSAGNRVVRLWVEASDQSLGFPP
jgi:hypothetical protein